MRIRPQTASAERSPDALITGASRGEDVLHISGLTRRFGKVVANDGICLRVQAGDVVGLLGHNGAGKTTLVSQLVGLLRPHAGQIHVGGIDAVAAPAAARRQVALQAQAQAPIDGLTPRSAIEVAARIRGLSRRDCRAVAIALAEELDIGPWLDRRALPDGAGLSGGIRRLTSFAMAIAAATPVLVLDEPTNDVDASRRRLLWEAVRRRADEGAGVLLVTHNVAEAERIVDELTILDRGQVVAAGSPSQLRGAQDSDLRLELRSPVAAMRGDDSGADASTPFDPLWEPIRDIAAPPVRRHARRGRSTVLTIAAEDAAAAVAWASALRDENLIADYALAPATLEDAYLAHTSPGSAARSDDGSLSGHGSVPDDDPSEEALHV